MVNTKQSVFLGGRLSDSVGLSCLWRCGQTVGRIKLKIGMEVASLGPGHIVLDGDSSPPPPKGRSPQFSDHICCGQMAAYGSRCHLVCSYIKPQPRRICVRWGRTPLSLPKKRTEPPIFGPCLSWPNGWMDQDDTWHGGKPQPRRLVL